MEKCYIDRTVCTGAKYYFCEDCKQTKIENADEIKRAKTPLELSAAHIPHKNGRKDG